jgi:hypothetical protein
MAEDSATSSDSSTASSGTGSSGGGGSGGSAPSESAEGVGESTGSESTEGGGEAGGERMPPVPKFKFRRGGRELEHTAEEMRAMLDDDFEHDFHGVGGKPLLVDGKPVKMKFADIARAVQMHSGALDSMRKYNSERERLAGIFEWGKKPENLQTFVEQHLGVEDYDSWLYDQARTLLQRDRQLVDLAQTDPVAHQNELRKLERQRFERAQQAKERAAQADRQKAQRAAEHQQWWGNAERAFAGVGLPMSDRTRAIAEGIAREYAPARADLSFEELAQLTRAALHQEILGYLDAQPDEQLLSFFGDKRRERLRQAELAAIKGKKAADKQAQKPEAQTPRTPEQQRREPRGMTAAEFLGRGKNGGRI